MMCLLIINNFIHILRGLIENSPSVILDYSNGLILQNQFDFFFVKTTFKIVKMI